METINIEESHSFILLLASMQIAGGYLLEWTPNIVSLIFIGHNGNDFLLSALGLGVMWANVFGFGIYTGLASGLETITAQAFGSNSFNTTSLQFWQCFWIVILLIISILMSSSEYILALLSVDRDVSSQAAYVCIGYIYAIMMNGFYAMTKGFLNGQQIYGITLITQLVTATSHVLSCYIFIQYLQWGLLGVIFARSITETLNVIVIWIVIFIKNCCKETLQKPNKQSLKGWGEFLTQTIPIGSIYVLEWIGYEMYTLQASLLSTQAFAACILLDNFGSFYLQISLGIAIAGSTFIGKSMGANQPKQAQEFSKTGLKITFFFILITLVPLYFLQRQFAYMFTTEILVQDEIVDVFLIFCIFMAVDSLQIMLTGIVRSIGYETQACSTFLVLYLGIGQILCYVLSQTAGLDLMGIVLATLIALSVYDLIILIIIVTAKWDEKALEIQAFYHEKEVNLDQNSNQKVSQQCIKQGDE